MLSGQIYRCSAGETFDSVALGIYGDERYASDLLSANASLCLLQEFAGGEVLYIPVVEYVEGDDEDEEEDVPAAPPWKEG